MSKKLLVFLGVCLLVYTGMYLNTTHSKNNTVVKAATTPDGACDTTLSGQGDKCSGGVLDSGVCEFRNEGGIAKGWTAYQIQGDPNYENVDYSSLGAGTILMTPNGNDTYIAGAYTQANVTSGKTYCASWRWGAPGPDNAPDAYGRTLGLDPTGGTNPSASTVIWGNTHFGPARHLDYVPPDVNVDVKTVAQSSTMTVFYKIDYTGYSGSSVMYIDGINLFDEGGSTNPTATPTPTTPGQATATPTPTPPPGATNTPTPPPGSDPTPTPTPTPITDCAQQQIQGNYNCTGSVDESDFADWLTDFNQGASALNLFEYWRRAFY
ncbi:MAG: hypothetical protein NUV98_02225 [Candidatus Roizmanbacteria bacterium]|nr:hypothetical protein [Candidatus Roizmanbacteria bacterium]